MEGGEGVFVGGWTERGGQVRGMFRGYDDLNVNIRSVTLDGWMFVRFCPW